MYAKSRALLVVLLHSGLALSSPLEADQGNWTVDGCILVRMAAQVGQRCRKLLEIFPLYFIL